MTIYCLYIFDRCVFGSSSPRTYAPVTPIPGTAIVSTTTTGTAPSVQNAPTTVVASSRASRTPSRPCLPLPLLRAPQRRARPSLARATRSRPPRVSSSPLATPSSSRRAPWCLSLRRLQRPAAAGRACPSTKRPSLSTASSSRCGT